MIDADVTKCRARKSQACDEFDADRSARRHEWQLPDHGLPDQSKVTSHIPHGEPEQNVEKLAIEETDSRSIERVGPAHLVTIHHIDTLIESIDQP